MSIAEWLDPLQTTLIQKKYTQRVYTHVHVCIHMYANKHCTHFHVLVEYNHSHAVYKYMHEY